MIEAYQHFEVKMVVGAAAMAHFMMAGWVGRGAGGDNGLAEEDIFSRVKSLGQIADRFESWSGPQNVVQYGICQSQSERISGNPAPSFVPFLH